MLTSTARPSLPPSPQLPQYDPMAHVFSIFQGLGQNFQQTFSAGQVQQQPGYLVNPAGNSNVPITRSPPAGGNILLDLMNRAQMLNGTSLVTAFRDRVDRLGDNNVVITRISNLFSQNRTRRQAEEVKPDGETKPEEAKPAEAVPEETKPNESIDDVVKRLKDEKEQTAPGSWVPGQAGQGSGVFTSSGTAGQIPTKLFEGLDGLLGVGSISGQGMTGLLDSVTRLIGRNGGNVTVAHASSNYNTSGEMNMPENRGRSLWDRLEERRVQHQERRREWSEKLRERMERRRNLRRGNDDTVITPPARETDGKPDLTDPQPVPVL